MQFVPSMRTANAAGVLFRLAATAAAAMLVLQCMSLPVHAQNDEPIKPLPTDIKLDAKKVALGEKLFNDKRLSKDNTMSCASCHDLGNGGIDGLPFSIGINGGKGLINAPTVFNSSFNFR